jgi:transcriptional regulator with XRE-family HTH domain
MGETNITSQVGRTIRYFRKSAGLSLEQLAEKMGVSYQLIQKYENGRTAINLVRLQQIAQALNMEIADFFEVKTAQKRSPSRQEVELLRAFSKIKNPKTKDSIYNIIVSLGKVGSKTDA